MSEGLQPAFDESSLTNEHFRILLAVRAGVFRMNENGRYIIPGQPRPDRKSREQLTRRGLIEDHYHYDRELRRGRWEWTLTEKGHAALDLIGANRA